MAERAAARRRRRRRARSSADRFDALYPRWIWPAFAAPAWVWLAAFFVLPLYAVLAIAMGTVSPIFGTTSPMWNPLHWNPAAFRFVWDGLVSSTGDFHDPLIRTGEYIVLALAGCLVIGYPVAYFIARYGGPRKALYLALLMVPFFISYLMRMLAWVDLLLSDGYVNRILVDLHVLAGPRDWLDGQGSTVVFGLIYGYIPYMILPLYASLDRIDAALLEAARDLGAGRLRTFLRVTLPLSKQAILAGSLIVALPMVGDYYTVDLLSASPRTSMVGNVVNYYITGSTQTDVGAAAVLLLILLLIPPMLYYIWSSNRASREAA